MVLTEIVALRVAIEGERGSQVHGYLAIADDLHTDTLASDQRSRESIDPRLALLRLAA